MKTKRIRTVANKKWSIDGHEYRGMMITLNTHVPTSYYGRYTIGSRMFTYLFEAKEYVDAKYTNAAKLEAA